MQAILSRLCSVLLISAALFIPDGVLGGCEDWELTDADDVCCKRCKPGHRLIQLCGPDPAKLCTPCESNRFTIHPRPWACSPCTQCIDPQVKLKPCNSSADTVCGCKPGFRCGDQNCKYCVMECSKGQEPTDHMTCRKCPAGTFNDKIHSACQPWRTSCPDGQYMTASGNELSDIKCSRTPDTTSSAKREITTPRETNIVKTVTKEDISSYLIIGCCVSSVFLIILILTLWFAYKRRTNNMSKRNDTKPEIQNRGELTIMMVKHEEPCSFHQPQQEQGSSDSINTQDSETKLLV